ncbi:MAG: GNAT family N-acetyltransferase [Deltaproteobacteria bacterium]|nr:MAG: GNAT family N-acetyltransferase [Deltaproteobacteria bacterium]
MPATARALGRGGGACRLLVTRSMQGSLVGLSEVRHHPGWKHWQHLTADAPPFLGPEFFTLAAPLSPGKDPVVAAAWDGDTMVGALPLVHDHHCLRALRCDHSPGYDYCGSPDGVDAIWRVLRSEPGWSQLILTRVPTASPLATRLPALAAADGCPSLIRREHAHLYLELAGFEDRLPTRFRANLQRCERKAGDVALERIPVPDRAAFDDALAIEAMAWKRAAGTSIDADPRVAHLYRALVMLVGRRGQGALYFLRAGGRRVATLVAVEDRHTLYALKIGYDPSAAKLSPGHLLIWKVAADAAARGLHDVDFVGRDDDWKYRWTDRGREQLTVVIYRDNARGLAHYAMSALVRPHLPETMRDSLRSPLPRHCQRADIIGAHTLVGRIRGRLDRGLGIKSGLIRVIKPPPAREHLGEPSAFAAGAWVRVKPAEALRATLDSRDRTRGLLFTEAQWKTAGRVHRVTRRRLRPRGTGARGLRPALPHDVPRRVARAGRGAAPRSAVRPAPPPRPRSRPRRDPRRPRPPRPARRPDLHARDARLRRQAVRDRQPADDRVRIRPLDHDARPDLHPRRPALHRRRGRRSRPVRPRLRADVARGLAPGRSLSGASRAGCYLPSRCFSKNAIEWPIASTMLPRLEAPWPSSGKMISPAGILRCSTCL